MAASQEDEIPVFVEIKTEPVDFNVHIKEEPLEQSEQHAYPEIEAITVKIEPTYLEHDEHLEAGETDVILPDLPIRTLVKPTPRKYKKRNKADSDEDYAPAKSKKKVPTVKKTYTTKAKKQENNYTEEVTQHIEVVTITDEERQREFKELWHARKHMRYVCEMCAVGYVMLEPYTMHMKCHSAEAGEHECDICHCRVKSADTLYRHRLRHFRRYRCTICLSQHKDKETAASHVMSRHSKRAFTCTECGSGFKRPAYLKKHMAQQHTKSEEHECPVCQRVFYDRTGLRCHVSESTKASTTEIQVIRSEKKTNAQKCKEYRERKKIGNVRVPKNSAQRSEECSEGDLLQEIKKPKSGAQRCKEYRERQKIKLQQKNTGHSQSKSAAEYKREYRRKIKLKKQYIQLNALLAKDISDRNHNEQARNPPAASVVCDTCSRRFRNKAHLRRHVRVHAARAEPCALCAATFKTRKGLRLHHEAKHQLKDRPAPAACPLCPRACTNPALLRQHIRRMHSDRTKKYQCDHCKRFYYSKGEVRSHIAWSHVRHAGSVHACACGRAFRTRARLRQHAARAHDRLEPPRAYRCHCGKAFTSKQVLSRHMKGHEGLTYPCPQCGLRFKSESYVKVHFKLRHLNMTRAQIKAEKQPRTLTYISGKKIYHKGMKMKRKEEEAVSEEKRELEVKEEDFNAIRVPLFDFVDLKQEPEDDYGD